ncbi:MAG: taurine dioxygenase [Pseudomonadota bacterium]
MHVEKAVTAIGGYVSSLDLTQNLSEQEFSALHDALMDHGVLFFRNQAISPVHFKQLADRFGVLQHHPAYPVTAECAEVSILESTKEKPTKIEAWHTDMTFMEKPPMATFLHGKIIPEVGGDTLWSSMTAAYEGLSDKMQRFISELEAVHSFAHGFKESLAEPGGYERLKQAIDDNPPVTHPVVRTHPVTGRKAIYVNSLFTMGIVDMKPRESRALLEMLWEHVMENEFICRFRWEPESIAIWDNRSTQHKPVNDYWPSHRQMHRITVEGDRPV